MFYQYPHLVESFLVSNKYCLFSHSGSPFSFKVVDASKVMASGEGLGLVPVNKKATFMVQAETASQQDLDIRITGRSELGHM